MAPRDAKSQVSSRFFITITSRTVHSTDRYSQALRRAPCCNKALTSLPLKPASLQGREGRMEQPAGMRTASLACMSKCQDAPCPYDRSWYKPPSTCWSGTGAWSDAEVLERGTIPDADSQRG